MRLALYTDTQTTTYHQSLSTHTIKLKTFWVLLATIENSSTVLPFLYCVCEAGRACTRSVSEPITIGLFMFPCAGTGSQASLLLLGDNFQTKMYVVSLQEGASRDPPTSPSDSDSYGLIWQLFRRLLARENWTEEQFVGQQQRSLWATVRGWEKDPRYHIFDGQRACFNSR